MMPLKNENATPVRIAIAQPAIPSYRVPFYSELFSRPGVDVSVVYSNVPGLKNDTSKLINNKIYYVASWRLPALSVEIGIYNLIAATRPVDVAVLSCNLRDVLLGLAIVIARLRGVKVVLWGHHKSKRPSTLERIFRRIVFSLSDAILCYDDETYLSLSAEFKEKVFVAPNAVDFVRSESSSMDVAEADSAELRKAHGIGASKIVLFVSRVKPRNRIDEFLDVIAYLKSEGNDIVGVIIGDEVGLDRKLADMVEAYGLVDSIRILGALYDESQIAKWFRAASVFFYPAQVGLSLMHAMAYGTPVVIGQDGRRRNPEVAILRHRHNGLEYVTGDKVVAASLIKWVISNPEESRKLAENARSCIETRHNIVCMVDGFVDACNAVAKS